MADTLLTLNDHGQRCVTQRQPNEDALDWLDRHVADLQASIANGFLLGAELVTSWDVAGGGRHQCPTSRNPGETDAQYLDRHFSTVVEQMGEYPPP